MQPFFGNAKAYYDDALLQIKTIGGASMFKVFAESVSGAQVRREQGRLQNLGIENVPNRTVRNVVGGRNRANRNRNPRA